MGKIYHSKDYLLQQTKTKDYIQIARENNVDPGTIHIYLRRYGLTKRRNTWKPEELRLLKDNYGINQDLHLLFADRSKSSVYHKANRLGLEREIRDGKYYVNKDFFKTWTSEMAYVFGWFCSDGNVAYAQNLCSIHLNSKDKEVLYKIRHVMKSNHSITEHSGSCQLRIYNKILRNNLIHLGCPPRKSLTLEFPEVPAKYLRHFVRGFFEGDGSIHFNKPNTIKVSFVGGNTFLDTLRRKLHKHVGINLGNMRKYHNIWVLLYFGNNARKLCSWMYNDCGELYLKRKKERFDNHIQKRLKRWDTNK